MDMQQVQRQEGRSQILKFLDRARPSPVNVALIERMLKQRNLQIDKSHLKQELDYLKQKAMVADTVQGLWHLLPNGVDVLEGSIVAPSGIPSSAAPSPDVIIHRHEVRWRVLLALNYARPLGATSTLLWRALDDSDLPVADVELARETGYLKGKGLVTVEGDLAASWHAKLTGDGIDLVEYAIDAPPGINRPDKYWED